MRAERSLFFFFFFLHHTTFIGHSCVDCKCCEKFKFCLLVAFKMRNRSFNVTLTQHWPIPRRFFLEVDSGPLVIGVNCSRHLLTHRYTAFWLSISIYTTFGNPPPLNVAAALSRSHADDLILVVSGFCGNTAVTRFIVLTLCWGLIIFGIFYQKKSNVLLKGLDWLTLIFTLILCSHGSKRFLLKENLIDFFP